MTAFRETICEKRVSDVEGGTATVTTPQSGSRQHLMTTGQQVDIDTLSAERSQMTSCGLKQQQQEQQQQQQESELHLQRHNVDCGRAYMSRVVSTADRGGRSGGDGMPETRLEKMYSLRWTPGPVEPRVPVVDCWIDEVLLHRANKEIRLANKYRSSAACRQVLYEKYLERPAGGDCSWWAEGLTSHGKRTLFEMQRKKAAKSQFHQHRGNSAPLPSWTMSWKNMFRYASNNNNDRNCLSSSTRPSRPSSSVSATAKSWSRRPMSAV